MTVMEEKKLLRFEKCSTVCISNSVGYQCSLNFFEMFQLVSKCSRTFDVRSFLDEQSMVDKTNCPRQRLMRQSIRSFNIPRATHRHLTQKAFPGRTISSVPGRVENLNQKCQVFQRDRRGWKGKGVFVSERL